MVSERLYEKKIPPSPPLSKGDKEREMHSTRMTKRFSSSSPLRTRRIKGDFFYDGLCSMEIKRAG
jgi:hypothetical protein